MGQTPSPDHNRDTAAPAESEPIVIDCDDCAVRGPACSDCVVSVLLGMPPDLREDERAALNVLADVGLAPRLRLVPVRGARPPARRYGVA